HDRDLTPTVDDARVKLRSFVDEVMLHVPELPSHINHSQWEYHWPHFQNARRLSSRIRSWGKTRQQHVATVATSIKSQIGLALHRTFGVARVAFHKMLEAVRVTFHKMLEAVRVTFHKTFEAAPRVTLQRKKLEATLRAKRKAAEFARAGGDSYLRPALRRFFGLEIVKSTTLSGIQKEANKAEWATKEVTRLEQQQREEQASNGRLEQQQREDQDLITRLEQQIARLEQQQREDQASITRLEQQQRKDQAWIARLEQQLQGEGQALITCL